MKENERARGRKKERERKYSKNSKSVQSDGNIALETKRFSFSFCLFEVQNLTKPRFERDEAQVGDSFGIVLFLLKFKFFLDFFYLCLLTSGQVFLTIFVLSPLIWFFPLVIFVFVFRFFSILLSCYSWFPLFARLFSDFVQLQRDDSPRHLREKSRSKRPRREMKSSLA